MRNWGGVGRLAIQNHALLLLQLPDNLEHCCINTQAQAPETDASLPFIVFQFARILSNRHCTASTTTKKCEPMHRARKPM